MVEYMRREKTCMQNSFRFFQNRDCEYFPCHRVEKEDGFNCLFCYCPLYFKEKCVGTPTFIINDRGQRIKDCSQCDKIHRPEMYDAVMHELQKQEDIISVNIGNLREEIWERMAQIASWNEMEKDMYHQHKGIAIGSIGDILERNKYLYRIAILLQPFSHRCIQKDCFSFGEMKVPCQVLERLERDQIEEGYLYAFHAPEYAVEEGKALLTQYYWEIFQIACMDVVREWIRKYLARKHSVKERRFCSPSFGPGFYGMEVEAAHQLLTLMDAGTVGIRWSEGKMQPQMSLVGMYLISRKDILSDCIDCASCIGQKQGCSFCSKNAGK